MPLQKGSSQKVISNNIKELHSGNTYAKTSAKFGKQKANKQAIAIAYNEAEGRAFGGIAPMMSQAMQSTMPSTPINSGASGIMPAPAQGSGMPDIAGSSGLAGSRGFAHGGVPTFKGPIVSSVPGRTDKHFTHVSSGSFVIPADIVSGHGQGNTLAGMNTLQKMFKMGPHTSVPKIGSNFGAKKFSKGGEIDESIGQPVPVKLAGGEIVIPPENAHETMQRITKKKLSLDEAHAAMDQWVLNQRKKLRKTLAGLPGPARD